MNVATEEVLGLIAVDEFADRSAARVHFVVHAIQIRIAGWSMADQHQGLQFRKRRQALSQFGFAIFSGRVERRGIGVTETGYVMRADTQRLAMKIVKGELLTEARDLRGGFVVAGQDVDAVAALLKDLAAFIEPAGPVHQIAGRKVVIGFGGHEAFESLVIAVDIGKNEQLQEPMIAREAARVVPIARKPERLPRVALARQDIVITVVLAGSRLLGWQPRGYSEVCDPGRGRA